MRDQTSDALENSAAQLQRRSAEAYLLLTFTMLCWGANAIMGQLAVGEVSPMLVVLGRWAGVMILCGVFMRRHLRRDWPILRKNLVFLSIAGALGFTSYNALFYLAAHSTSGLNIGILQGAMPVFVAMGAFLVYRTRITYLQFLGVVLTLAGVIIIASEGSLGRLLHLQFKLGDLLMICASFLYAGYTIALRKRPAVSPLSLFAVMAASAFVVSIPLAGIEYGFGASQWPSPFGWMVIALITIFPSFLAQLFFIYGVDRVGPSRAGVFMNLVPIFAAGMAVLVLKEAFEIYHAIALTLVLIGIYLSEKFKAAG
ncbi:MAG: DMT family transporter [Alphaproteobacteria bacterium]|nr:DMT family transporter [Alphaproteobacteria bacterium]